MWPAGTTRPPRPHGHARARGRRLPTGRPPRAAPPFPAAALGRAALTILRALPPRWLPPLAGALARAERRLGRATTRRATTAWGLVFGGEGRAWSEDAPLAQAARLRWLDRLAAWHRRNAWSRAARAGLAHLPPGPLYLVPALGWPALLAARGRGAVRNTAALEAAPRHPTDAAPIELLGRWTLVDACAVRTALARDRAIHLLLLLPAADGLPRAWTSPELGHGAAPGEVVAVLQRAFDVLAVLARARPDLLDWSAPRWGLRAGLELEGHPPWSRWAPWRADDARRARGTGSRPPAPAAGRDRAPS